MEFHCIYTRKLLYPRNTFVFQDRAQKQIHKNVWCGLLKWISPVKYDFRIRHGSQNPAIPKKELILISLPILAFLSNLSRPSLEHFTGFVSSTRVPLEKKERGTPKDTEYTIIFARGTPRSTLEAREGRSRWWNLQNRDRRRTTACRGLYRSWKKRRDATRRFSCPNRPSRSGCQRPQTFVSAQGGHATILQRVVDDPLAPSRPLQICFSRFGVAWIIYSISWLDQRCFCHHPFCHRA